MPECAAAGRHRDLPVRQRPPVLHDVALGAEHRPDPVARIVVLEVPGDSPLKSRVEALPDGLGADRRGVLDGGEDRQHVGACRSKRSQRPDGSWVACHDFIRRQQREPFDLGLCHQDAVERVLVDWRKQIHRHCMSTGHGQFHITVLQ